MHMKFFACLSFLLVSTAANAESPGVTAIVDATIFDGTGTPPFVATVTIANGRIQSIAKGAKLPRGAKVVDAKGKALLPGFFDVHTHWTPSGNPPSTPHIASAYVKAGVTTVNDFHQQPESFAPRRAWLAQLVAPHVLFAARISTPGGHGADWADEATTIPISTPEGGRAAIRDLLPYRPDLIKVFADGWRYGIAPNNTSINVDALTAVTDAAHKQGWPVVTHTVTVERGVEAARAGVDSLAHVVQDRKITAEEIAAIKKDGMLMAPTLAVYEPNKPGRPPRDPTDHRTISIHNRFENALYNVKALHDAGVPIALGTDAGMPSAEHGVSTLREMELLVQAGLTPSQALLAGTSVSAHLMRVDKDRGTIEAGKRADIVLVDGAPWQQIADIYKTWQVYVDGKLVSGVGAPALPPLNRTDRLPSKSIAALVDDFERADGRSSLDTLRLDTPDGGMDRSIQVAEVIAREGGGHALSVSAKLSQKEEPIAGVAIPLTRGSVTPVDLRNYNGVSLEIRGRGTYRVVLNGYDGVWEAQVPASAEWKAVEIPFSAFKPSAPKTGAPAPGWSGDGFTQIGVAGTGEAGTRIWLMIDTVKFF